MVPGRLDATLATASSADELQKAMSPTASRVEAEGLALAGGVVAEVDSRAPAWLGDAEGSTGARVSRGTASTASATRRAATATRSKRKRVGRKGITGQP